jgi:predicted GNAT family acetyltransferase
LLDLIGEAGVGRPDHCHFRTLAADDLRMHGPIEGFAEPRLATGDDMEKLIDFYQVGFYSLANLPTRSAWRTRLTEQLAFRTMFLIEDSEGRIASCALSSAEGGGAAMIGGVATLPLYRGRGLSALCVGALCEHLFRAGISTISLFYLWNNDPAGRVYDKLGFAYSGDWLLVPVGFGVAFNPLMQFTPRDTG